MSAPVISRKSAKAALSKISELRQEAETRMRARHLPGTLGHSRYFLNDGRLSADGTIEVGNTVLAQLEGVLQFFADGAK